MKNLLCFMLFAVSLPALAGETCNDCYPRFDNNLPAGTQQQNQTATSGSAATNAGSGNGSGNGNTTNNTFTSPGNTHTEISGTQTIKNVPSVNGPPLTTSNDTCMGSTSGSLNFAGVGLGGGSTWVDNNCKRLKNARELWNMGMKGAGMALMCKDPENREALESTGYVCPVPPEKKKSGATSGSTESSNTSSAASVLLVGSN